MNLSTVDRTRTRQGPGAPDTTRGIRPHRAAAAIESVEFTEPDGGAPTAEQHPRADRSAENMRTLRTPFTACPAEESAAA